MTGPLKYGDVLPSGFKVGCWSCEDGKPHDPHHHVPIFTAPRPAAVEEARQHLIEITAVAPWEEFEEGLDSLIAAAQREQADRLDDDCNCGSVRWARDAMQRAANIDYHSSSCVLAERRRALSHGERQPCPECDGGGLGCPQCSANPLAVKSYSRAATEEGA